MRILGLHVGALARAQGKSRVGLNEHGELLNLVELADISEHLEQKSNE